MMNQENIYSTTSSAADYEYNINLNLLKYIDVMRAQNRSVHNKKFRYHNQNHDIEGVVGGVCANIGGSQYFIYTKSAAYVKGDDMFCIVYMQDEFTDKTEISVFGSEAKVQEFFDVLADKKNNSTIAWYYKTNYGNAKKDIDLQIEYSSKDCYYPYIQPSLDAYYDAYLKSSSSILILMGEPGCGKTSFIRNMIKEKDLSAIVTYDESVLSSDDFFITYLLSKENNLLVVEDADILLSSREKDDNKIMSKLLNVSEGLVKLFNKKIVFTTNIAQVNRLDPAIIRPGRCFDVLSTRSLTKKEAQVIVDKDGLEPLPKGKSEFTLSEIFNRRAAIKPSLVGFI